MKKLDTKNIVLLDGGLGQEINRRSRQDKSHPLWSVDVMMNEPDLVVKVHEDFIKAGARVLCPNNYAATPMRLKKFDLESRLTDIHRKAIALMDEAVSRSGVNPKDISRLGCLPPLVSSYVASAAPNYDDAYDQYSMLLELQQPFVDGFLVETMSNLTEIRAVIDVLNTANEPIYLALTIKDDGTNSLRSGESIESALELLVRHRVGACLINCSRPESVTKALPLIAKSGLVFGAYANGFTSINALRPYGNVDALEKRIDLTHEVYCEHVLGWIDCGASIVGGCCEITPKHISFLHEALNSRGITCSKLI
ncbi:homocysteine S-methyltransferase family protein [Litorivicinus sp.]|nr:homocysteine S-methyltransferase family protein [Litorivicinus sp.]MDC1207873.1 homocysteine S-methyltransferase family protein [Litorivicinus sp.]MDC1239646.1 homocysteine S-methyltransferase family protein [Litorivicinus sp.]